MAASDEITRYLEQLVRDREWSSAFGGDSEEGVEDEDEEEDDGEYEEESGGSDGGIEVGISEEENANVENGGVSGNDVDENSQNDLLSFAETDEYDEGTTIVGPEYVETIGTEVHRFESESSEYEYDVNDYEFVPAPNNNAQNSGGGDADVNGGHIVFHHTPMRRPNIVQDIVGTGNNTTIVEGARLNVINLNRLAARRLALIRQLVLGYRYPYLVRSNIYI